MIKKRFPDLPMVVRLHTPNYVVESLKKTYVPLHRKLRFVIGSLKRKSFDLGYWRKYNRNEDPDYKFTLLADAISAPSVYLKNWVVNNWKIDPVKIKVYSNIFEPPSSFSQLPIYDDFRYKTIVFYGRLDVLKGLRNATIAVKYILGKYPDWHFRVIGNDCSGPDPLSISMRNWMKIKLKKYESQISFFDRIEYLRLSEFINESEILIFPSLFESFSYVCIEGMAAGKAIVGSKLGGMNDLIQNNETGILVNPYNIKEIINSLEKLISNQAYTFNIRKAARDKVLKSEHNERIINETLIYYKNVIQYKRF
jgi:glycosyltransferase involved in cell wall biosynthesis